MVKKASPDQGHPPRNPKVLWGLSNAQLASLLSVLAGVVLIVAAALRRADRFNRPAIDSEKPA